MSSQGAALTNTWNIKVSYLNYLGKDRMHNLSNHFAMAQSRREIFGRIAANKKINISWSHRLDNLRYSKTDIPKNAKYQNWFVYQVA